MTHASEWQDIHLLRPPAYDNLLAQALVARGFLKRQWRGNAAIYTNQNGNVLARFCMCETFVDCLAA